jgi:hypothetical protein
MYFHSKDNYFLSTILVLRASASKCLPSAAEELVFSFQGQLFSLAHFSILKCPSKAA